MQVSKQKLELDMEQQTGSKSGKEYVKAVYCHPAYLPYIYAEYIMRNTGLDEAQAGIIKAIHPECSLKGPVLKLKLQYFGHLMQRANSLKKTLTLVKTEGQRSRG